MIPVLESMVVVRFTYEGVAAALVLVVGVLAGIGYLIRLLRKAVRYLVALHSTVDRELNHNHGSSIKDDTHGTAITVGQLWRELEQVKKDLYAHLDQASGRHSL